MPVTRGANKRPEAVVALQTPDDMDSWVQQREKTLLVIDVHPEWCGPCSDVLDSFCRKIALDVNSSSSSSAGAGEEITTGENGGTEGGGGVQFLTADRQLLGGKLRALFFPSSPAKDGASSNGKPTAAAPAAVAAQFTMNDGSGGAGGAAPVAALLESGGCRPLFLFVKGRQLVAAVQGTDTPAIAQLIQQHVGSGGGGGGSGA